MKHGDVLRRRLAYALVAALAFGAGTVYTAFGAAQGDTYYACLSRGTLTSVTVGSTPTCRRGATLVSWNQVGPTGPAGMEWMGSWNGSVSYAQNDAVSYQGSSYVANAATVPGEVPGASAKWDLLAQQGSQGDKGDPGTAGRPGKDGVSVVSADAVTLTAGSDATASFDVNTGELHLGIPAGTKGDKGDKGDTGDPGAAGSDGASGKDGVSVQSADADTLPPGSSATASFDPNTGNIHLGIPQGAKGDKGDPGPKGPGVVLCPNCDFRYIGSALAGLDLSHAVLNGSDFTVPGNAPLLDLSNTNFTGANLSNAHIGDVSAAGADFANAILQGALFQGFGYRQGHGQYPIFANADLTGAVFTTSTDLTGIDLSTATITNVVWDSSVTCPDGSSALSHPDASTPSHYTCIGHLSPSSP